jgi:hypothetical protein
MRRICCSPFCDARQAGPLSSRHPSRTGSIWHRSRLSRSRRKIPTFPLKFLGVSRRFASAVSDSYPPMNQIDRLACDASPGEGSIFSHLRSPIDIRHPAKRRRRCRQVGYAVAQDGDAKVFKKYSRMKLQMKRDALAKLNRQANESGPGLAQQRGRKSENDGTPIEQLFWNQQKVWSGRGDSNARPPAPKAGALPGCATPRHVKLL